jgi:hypothetical protein
MVTKRFHLPSFRLTRAVLGFPLIESKPVVGMQMKQQRPVMVHHVLRNPSVL